jgi:hypothetical protein
MAYCSRECQRLDWPRHKTICGVVLNWSSQLPVQIMPARVTHTQYHFPQGPPEKAYDILVRHEDEQLVYKLVIDAYRCIDEVKRDYNPQFFDLTAFYCWLDGYSFTGLQRFLDRTLHEGIDSLFMPLWWNKEHRDACEKLAFEQYHWADLPNTTVAREVNEYHRYGGAGIRLSLRIVALNIHGSSAKTLDPEALERAHGLNALDMLEYLSQPQPYSEDP